METKNTRFERLINESLKELDDIGIHINRNIRYSIDEKSKRRWGVCIKKNEIKISEFLFSFSDNIIKDTLIHEMLHTLQDTKGHDTKWKWYADRVNHNYPQYNITRLASSSDLKKDMPEQDIEKIMGYKWKTICKGCGHVHYNIKMSEWTKKCIKNGSCRCGKCNSKEFDLIKLT